MRNAKRIPDRSPLIQDNETLSALRIEQENGWKDIRMIQPEEDIADSGEPQKQRRIEAQALGPEVAMVWRSKTKALACRSRDDPAA